MTLKTKWRGKWWIRQLLLLLVIAHVVTFRLAKGYDAAAFFPQTKVFGRLSKKSSPSSPLLFQNSERDPTNQDATLKETLFDLGESKGATQRNSNNNGRIVPNGLVDLADRWDGNETKRSDKATANDPVLSMGDSFVNMFASFGKLLSNAIFPTFSQDKPKQERPNEKIDVAPSMTDLPRVLEGPYSNVNIVEETLVVEAKIAQSTVTSPPSTYDVENVAIEAMPTKTDLPFLLEDPHLNAIPLEETLVELEKGGASGLKAPLLAKNFEQAAVEGMLLTTKLHSVLVDSDIDAEVLRETLMEQATESEHDFTKPPPDQNLEEVQSISTIARPPSMLEDPRLGVKVSKEATKKKRELPIAIKTSPIEKARIIEPSAVNDDKVDESHTASTNVWGMGMDRSTEPKLEVVLEAPAKSWRKGVALSTETKGVKSDSKTNLPSAVDFTGFDDDFSKEDWEASVRAAQKSIDGSIAGLDLDDVLLEENELSDWQAAQKLAKQLGQASPVATKVAKGDDDEVDRQALAVAARQAVEAFEKQSQTDEERKTRQRERWSSKQLTYTTIPEPKQKHNWSQCTVSHLKDELDRRGLRKSGKKADLIARLEEASMQAPEQILDNSVAATINPPDSIVLTDWSSSRVVDLKKELQNRGLPTAGKKADLVAALEKSDRRLLQTQEQHSATTNVLVRSEDEVSLEDLAGAARAAVLLFESTKGLSEEDAESVQEALPINIIDRRDELSDIFHISTYEKSDAALESVNLDADCEGTGELARAAREAVALFETSNNFISKGTNTQSVQASSTRDWSKLTVAQLRDELTNRALPTKGTKIELIASLKAFEYQEMSGTSYEDDVKGDLSIDEFELSFNDLDLDALGKAARDAVLLFEADDEPSDEMLLAIENEIESDGSVALPDDFMTKTEKPPLIVPALEYASLAVSQLKGELKRRGLRVTGKKVDLVARLQASDADIGSAL